ALNNGGTINAQQALGFTGTHLDNSNGVLTGAAGVTLDLLGTLTNTNGTLGANDKLSVDAVGAVLNDKGGLIASRNGDLQLKAASLGNAKGSLQGKGAVDLDVSGDIDSQSGKIIAQDGDLFIKAANLDSRGGVLSSIKGAFEAHVVGVLKNGYDLDNNRQGGLVQAQRLSLSAFGGVDNYGGRIAAQAGDTVIDAGTGNVDNRNGGVYATGLIKTSGNSLDNSGDSGGQLAAGQIDLKLNGDLNNRKGIIESSSNLSIAAASVDNQNGQLRALGASGKTEFQIGGLFDNRSGQLEIANSDLSLDAAGFQNQGGSLLHLGNGTLDIATANVLNAGGSLVTRGDLTLVADSWTNSSIIQAGRLTLNIGTLNQIAGAQLLASTRLSGTGGNWSNDGLIASDGSSDLSLTGSYSGNGRYSSLGTLGLSTATVSLGSNASIAGGADTTINVAGLLGNYGRITSAAGMTVTAGGINNYGTLGTTGNLRLSTANLLNDKGLIFSGGDMALRTDTFTNRYADVYSFGNLGIAKDDSNGQGSSINNISSTIESGGDLSLSAAHIENRKDVFQATGGMVSAYIGIRCYSCSMFVPAIGHQEDGYLVWVQNYKSQIVQDSASASMTAGRNFQANGQEFLNSASTVSAGNNLTLNLQTFINQGASVGDYSIRRSFLPNVDLRNMNFWVSVMNYDAANDPSVQYFAGLPSLHAWNANNDESSFRILSKSGGRGDNPYTSFGIVHVDGNPDVRSISPAHYNPNGPFAEAPAAVQNATFFENTLTYNSPSTYANAVVQAGGAVNITATQNLTNSVIREGVVIDGVASRVGSTQVGNSTATLVNINRQLPPDLAQQQVNPLALPGFSLPTGHNGLFRLSDAASSSPADQGPQSWTLSGTSLSTAQRQQIQPAAQLTAVALSDNTQTGSTGPLPLARVQGLPSTTGQSRPQKYLIETNPAFADLKQFVSSDYLLSRLGYNDEDSTKRLGDGFYEQKLIQQAVVARTGQRFIDGQTSDESLFKYLMDNAVSSKQQLNLSVGVSLTSEQVAALTHDIVWMEKQVVNGEEVLVPVLYLAQANNRLAPNGALIQGADLTLIAGKDLNNAGTLRASNNLSATAGNDLVNSSLIEGGNRLDLLAGGDIVNKAGGIIAGRDVSMVAIAGDVINQRTVVGNNINYQGYNGRNEYADSGARIEAANDLTVKAARDFVSTGSTLKSGGDTTITAGRDVFIASAEQHNSVVLGAKSSSITQYGSNVTVGRDFSVQAGRDLAVVASQIEAKRNVDFGAGENLTVTSAADELHSYSKSKKVTAQEDHVKQISSVVSAGQDITFNAGKDMALVSSRINAGNEAYLAAVGKLDVLAAQDTDYSLYDKKDKGSWGSKQTKHDEVTKITNVGTQITTGSDLTLVSGGDQRYQVAKLDSGADLTLRSGGAITFEGVKDLSQESHEKTNNSLAWNSSKGKGHTDETLRQSELISKGDLAITAAKGVHIDIRQIDQKTVSQTIDAMVQADPQLAWLKEAEQRGDVDWQRVKEVHDSFKYSNSGMGMGAMLAVVIVVTIITAGSGTAATVGSTASGAATAVGVSTTTAAAIGAAASAAYTAAVVQSVVSTINNKGNLGAVLKDVTSAESIKGYVTSGLVAGFASGVLDKAFGVSAEDASKATHGFDLANTSELTKFAGYTLAEKGFGAVTNTAINGGSLKSNLAQATISAAADVLSASIYNRLGTQLEFTGVPAKVGAHAIVGGLIAEAAGGSFRTGALAAGANEAFVASVGDKIFVGDMHDQLLAMTSQLIGVTVAAAAGGSDKDQEVAGWVTQQATKFNSLDHPTAERLLNELKACKAGGNCTEAKQRDLVSKFEKISAERSQLIDLCESRACVEGLQANTIAMDDPVAQELLSFYRNKVSYDMVGMLAGNPGLIAQPAQGYDPWGNTYVTDDQIITAKYIKEGWLTPAESANLKEWEDKTSWLDNAVGHKLSVAERAAMISNMGNTLLTEGWGTKVTASIGKGGKTGNGVSEDADGFGVNPGKGPCCFAAGTMVATPSGDRAIDSLKVGDIVWSKPDKGGKPFAAAILATHYRNDQPIYRLKLENIRADGLAEAETLLVTPSHPFYVPERRDFIPAIELKPGDLLQSLSDGEGENASTRVTSLELFLPVGETYNLTVDIGHTFYVGKLKTWVHNTGTNAPCSIDGRPVAGEGPKATTNAPNTPRFITDSAGNTIDLDYTKGLRETNVAVTGTRGGVQYPLQGQTPDSYANLGNGHVVVYGPEGRALYDVSSSRIKVVEWNQAPNGTYFPKKGSDTKIFEGNVPQSVLDSLGLK
ncbi:DUF637 domain-containing protein, partial [Pseudomonas gingeri]